MRPGDPLRNHRQRAIMLALILKPVLANEDGVSMPAPLAHQCRTGCRNDTGIERPASPLELPGQRVQAAPQSPARPAKSTFLQLMDERSDQQIATESLRRAGAMQLPPRQPQFGCGAIEQLGNLMVDLGDIRTAG